MPGGAGLEGLQGSRVGLSEEGSLVEESVWNKGPGAATSSLQPELCPLAQRLPWGWSWTSFLHL